MALVITNGTHYVRYGENGGIKFTDDLNEAQVYPNRYVAVRDMYKAPGKTKNCYIFDNLTNTIVWKWLSDEEKAALSEKKRQKAGIKRNASGKIKRKHYSDNVRKILYNNADGRCQLCGRQILFSEHTVDHIIPLSMGGLDDVSNLQICCLPCNQMKNNVLPELFCSRIADIFLYQMEKKEGNSFRWKIVHRILKNMI